MKQLSSVAIIGYPHLQGQAEFQPLLHVPGMQVVWAHTTQALAEVDLLILPSSAAITADLQWLRRQKLDAAIVAHAQSGKHLLGIGAGLAMLGEALIDWHNIAGNEAGLGLLPLVTVLAAETSVVEARVHLPALRAPWDACKAMDLQVRQQHVGATQLRADMQASHALKADEPVTGCVWQSAQGNVWGTYWHGLLENPALLEALWPTRDAANS